jgi:DNA repair exonuclease SbcCD ATPase subunit
MAERIQAKIEEKLAQKRAQTEDKIQTLRQRIDDLTPDTEELEKELSALEETLDEIDKDANPSRYARLEARRERLLAHLERLKMKQELLAHRIELLQEQLSELESQWRGERTERTTATSTENERRKILEMVASGKISAAEAEKLLSALSQREQPEPEHRRGPGRFVRFLITDTATHQKHLDIKLPLNLVRSALRRGTTLFPNLDVGGLSFDAQELQQLLQSGAEGHIIDIVGEDEHIQVIIE